MKTDPLIDRLKAAQHALTVFNTLYEGLKRTPEQDWTIRHGINQLEIAIREVEKNPDTSGQVEKMTLREHYAGLAMQASIAVDQEYCFDPKNHADYAVRSADALIAELKKKGPNTNG